MGHGREDGIRTSKNSVADLGFRNLAASDGFHNARRFEFLDANSKVTRVWIHSTKEIQDRPVYLLSRRRARVSTHQVEGIAGYAELRVPDYFKLCNLVALVQLKALVENPLLQPEDLECQSDPVCLFTWRDSYSEYAHVFESRTVCSGCLQFYQAVSVEREILQLKRESAV